MTHIIHFVADFPVIICVNKICIGEIEKPYDTLSIEEQEEQKLILQISPINSKNFCESICYTAEIKIFNSIIKTNSNFLEITNYDDVNFEIKVLPMNVVIKKTQQIIQKIEINQNIFATLFDDGNLNLQISTKTKIFNYILKEKISNLKCDYFNENNNEFLFFYGKTHKNQDYLLIFYNFFCIFENAGDVIEFTKNEIKVLNEQNDISQHAIIQIYSFQDGEFLLKDEYTALLQNEIKMVDDENLIPWAFCEAVNLSNIKLARKYLDATLNELLTDDHILTFFGNYCEFTWNKYQNAKNIICFLYGEKEKTCKHFLFEISENKITNITCLD